MDHVALTALAFAPEDLLALGWVALNNSVVCGGTQVTDVSDNLPDIHGVQADRGHTGARNTVLHCVKDALIALSRVFGAGGQSWSAFAFGASHAVADRTVVIEEFPALLDNLLAMSQWVCIA
jgi:hypothetical protein